MKNRILKFMVLAIALIFFVFTFSNVAHAEEVEDNTENAEEETTSIIGQTYTYTEDEKTLTFTILDETNAECIISNGVESVTSTMQYTYIDGVLTFSMLGDEIGSFINGENNVLTVYDVPVIPEEPIEQPKEEIDFGESIKNFLKEWMIVILATLGGAGGTSIALAIAKALLKKITDKVEESAKNNKDSNETLAKTQETVANGLEMLTAKIAEFETKYSSNFEETSERIIKCIQEIDTLKTDNKKFKELVAFLVSSNAQLASNGYATKILELLDEGCEANE
jgi:hypothetical protein